MTEDLIAMARKSMLAIWHKDLKRWVVDPNLEAFAALIEARAVARTREECASLCEQWNASNPERLAAAIRALGERT